MKKLQFFLSAIMLLTVSVAEAIRKLLINSDLRKEMGECGHRRFQKEFTVEAFESRLIGILKQELGA